MDNIEIVSSTSGQVDKSKGTRILRLCLVWENCPSAQRQIKDWKGQLTNFQSFASTKNYSVSMENPIEFEWNILPGVTSLQIIQKIQGDLEGRNIEPKHLEIRSSSCLGSTTLIGQERDMKRNVYRIPKKSKFTRRDSRKDIGRLLTLETKSTVMEYGNRKCKP